MKRICIDLYAYLYDRYEEAKKKNDQTGRHSAATLWSAKRMVSYANYDSRDLVVLCIQRKRYYTHSVEYMDGDGNNTNSNSDNVDNAMMMATLCTGATKWIELIN